MESNKGRPGMVGVDVLTCRDLPIRAFDLNHVLEGQPNLFRCDTRDAHGILSAVRTP